MSISEKIVHYKEKVGTDVKLIAVSKTQPVASIFEAYQAGQRLFGENKVQELVSKQSLLPGDIEWHFIGHLQTNKVKQIVPIAPMIHGVDSLRLLNEINKESQKQGKIMNCLLQFHIASEETKFGFSFEEAQSMLDSDAFSSLKHVRICGVMGMATFTGDMSIVRKEFQHLKKIFNFLRKNYFSSSEYFKEISMGMSDDYKVAIEEGSTMVRIGTAIFGERYYQK